MKLKEKINNKIIVGFFLIIIGLTIISCNSLYNEVEQNETEDKINNFIEKQSDDNNKIQVNGNDKNDNKNNVKEATEKFIAVIEIPKINLRNGIYEKNSLLNNVDKNVQILKDSSFPNEKNGNVILAAHSGSGKVAYFKNLVKLEKNDNINIYYDNNIYSYKVEKIYKVDKTGKIELEDHSSSILTLITCDQQDKSKQIVVIAIQVSSDKS